MTNLSALRQRIATVETIKKTTHAMRLIAMSNHARLRNDIERLKSYGADLRSLGSLQRPVKHERPVIVIVASEKGLCGSFNTALFEHCSREILPNNHDASYISVGRQAREYLEGVSIVPIKRYEPLSIATWQDHGDALTRYLAESHARSPLAVVHSTSSSFFVRSIGMHSFLTTSSSHTAIQEYLIEGDFNEIARWREILELKAFILERIGDSLIAEQAARFMSMDLATRNAETLLEAMRLDYNKMRQALITRELADLSSAL